MKMVIEINKVKLTLVFIGLTFGIKAQINPIDLEGVIKTIELKVLNQKSIVYLLEEKPNYNLIRKENKKLIAHKKSLNFFVRKRMLKLNDRYIQDTVMNDWSEIKFQSLSLISDKRAKEIYKENQKENDKKYVVTIVNPAYSKNKRSCITNIVYKKGPNNGEAIFFYLKKKGKKWVIKRKYTLLTA